MKKMLTVMAMMFVFAIFSGLAYGQSTAKDNKTLDQLKGVQKSSSDAKKDVEKGNLGKGKPEAGKGFDTRQDNTPAVNLSGKKGVVDPKDLKKDDPKPPSLKIKPPPPLK